MIVRLRATRGAWPGWTARGRISVDHDGDAVLIIDGEPFGPADCEHNGFVAIEGDLDRLSELGEAGYSIPVLH